MITLNFKHDPPKFRRPELLIHPTIPERLFGVNPRTIEGQEWWDVVRKVAYRKNNYCCWACGSHKSKDPFHQWLEAHEWYDYDTTKCIATLNEVVALCPTCHMFIHIGNAYRIYVNGEITKSDLRGIIIYGIETLKTVKLKPSWGALTIASRVFSDKERKNLNIKKRSDADLNTYSVAAAMERCHDNWQLLYKGVLYSRDSRGNLSAWKQTKK